MKLQIDKALKSWTLMRFHPTFYSSATFKKNCIWWTHLIKIEKQIASAHCTTTMHFGIKYWTFRLFPPLNFHKSLSCDMNSTSTSFLHRIPYKAYIGSKQEVNSIFSCNQWLYNWLIFLGWTNCTGHSGNLFFQIRTKFEVKCNNCQ